MRIMLIVALALCASCGKISDARDALAFKDVGEANFAVRDRFSDMPGTAFRAIPTSGTASFNGAARVFLIAMETR